MIRRRSLFSGRVQGVGFRYTVLELARNYRVTGWVRNLPDGRVELIAEGESVEIDGLLADVGRKMEGFIKQRQDDDSPPTGEFSDFSVRR